MFKSFAVNLFRGGARKPKTRGAAVRSNTGAAPATSGAANPSPQPPARKSDSDARTPAKPGNAAKTGTPSNGSNGSNGSDGGSKSPASTSTASANPASKTDLSNSEPSRSDASNGAHVNGNSSHQAAVNQVATNGSASHGAALNGGASNGSASNGTGHSVGAQSRVSTNGALSTGAPARDTLVRSQERARVLCVASGKGGTGKSVVAANLAVLRAQRGERVLLIDFDAGMANAHLLLGVQPRFDLGHVLDGEVSAAYAAVRGPAGMHLIAGGVGRSALLNPTPRELERLFTALVPLEEQFDLIIVDHGAGLSYATLAHLAAATRLLLVTTHEVTALSDAYALYKQATLVNPTIHAGVVLNRAPDERTAMAAWDRFRAASGKFLAHTPEFVGWVPHDDAVGRSVQARTPIILREPHSAAGEAIERVARWREIDEARVRGSFYEAARRALR